MIRSFIRGKSPGQVIDALFWRINLLARDCSLTKLRKKRLKQEKDWIEKTNSVGFVLSRAEAHNILSNHPEDHTAIFAEAEDILEGWTDVPGFGRRRINLDYPDTSGFKDKYAYRLLCRLDFLRPLVWASLLAKDNLAFIEAVEKHLINWQEIHSKEAKWDSVDESIRVLNILEALALLKDDLKKEVFRSALKNILDAVWTIHANRARTGNHLIYEGLALYYAGNCLKSYYQAKVWRDLGAEILENAMRVQVFTDGMNAELCTSYHLITATNFLKAWALGRKVKRNFHGAFNLRLAQMVMIANKLRAGDGGFFALGDSDRMEGPSREEREARSLANLGKMIAHSGDAGRSALGIEYLLAGLDSGSNAEYDYASQKSIINAGGYQILRDKNGNSMIFDTGPFGLSGASHHAHADTLSIEAHMPDCRFLIDPGGFSYVDEKARAFARSTAAHNTVRIDELNSSEILGSFEFGKGANARLIDSYEIKDGFVLCAEHDGYKRLKLPVFHRRAIVWLTRLPFFMLVIDRVEGKGAHLIEAFFHADKIWQVSQKEHNQIRWSSESCRIIHSAWGSREMEISIHKGEHEPQWQGWIAPRYGEYVEAPVLVEKCHADLPVDIVNLFVATDDLSPITVLDADNCSVTIGKDQKLNWNWEGDRLAAVVE